MTKPTPPQPESTERDRSRLLPAALAVTFVIVAAAALVPAAKEWRLWGINHLAFYDMPVRLVAVMVMALAFIPSVARAAWNGLLKVPGALAQGGNRSTVVMVLLAVGCVFLFYELQAATTLLGDGQLLTKSYEVGQQGHRTVVMRSVPAILRNELISPGQTLLYYGMVELGTGPFGATVAGALAVLPCLLGGIYIFLLLKLVRDAPVTDALKVWLLVLGLFTASLQLFFGYIENYSAIFVLLAVYVATGFMVIHRRIGWWVPVVVLVVSTYMHIQSLVFAPSLVFLLTWVATGRRRAGGARLLVPALVTLTVGGALVARSLGIPGDFYLPWTADDATYGVFTPQHLLDMLNEVFMLLPIVLFVLAAWWTGRRAAAAGRTEKPETVWFTRPHEWQFVAVMIVACSVYMTLFKPEIGMARDWDLFTMTTAALVPFALLVFKRYLVAARPSMERAAAVFVPAVTITAVMTASWIGVNASADRTTDRFEAILAYDQTHAGYAYENLATFYHDRKQLPQAIAAMEKGALISGNPRLYARLAVYYEENGDVQSGIALLTDVLDVHPDHDKARQKLLDLLEKAHDWDRLLEVSREGMSLHPGKPIYCFAAGIALIRTGRGNEAVPVFRDCMKLDAPEAMRNHMQQFLDDYGHLVPEGQ